MFSHNRPISQLTLLKRFLRRAIRFLSLASRLTRLRSGAGRSSDMHLASRIAVSQRRATFPRDYRRATSGRVRKTRSW